MVQFTNADVAAKYEACRANDGRIHIPAGKDKNGYAGLLSGITLVAADKAYASGSNLLKLKQEAKPPKETKPSSNGSTLST
jgi:hypothetical protein